MQRAYPVRGYAIFLITLLSLFVAGCSKTPDNVTGTTPPPDATTDGASISDDARDVSLHDAETVFRRLPGTDPAADRLTVLAYFKTRPEFADAGLSEDKGNVWARYTDGRLVLYVNNRAPGQPPSGRTIPGGQSAPKSNMLNKTSNAFPGTSSARIINSLGTVFGYTRTAVESLKTWCKATGYTLSFPNSATIENLKLMKGDGIFYWTTHGGFGRLITDAAATTYSLWTSESRSKANDAAHRAELNSGIVNYMYCQNNNDSEGNPDTVSHYSVTKDFMSIFMAETFAHNSLVYIDACNSAVLPKEALTNAGFFLGWDNITPDKGSAEAAMYFFDKALGVNRMTPKASPPERPFFTGSVLREMTNKGLNRAGDGTAKNPYAYLVHPHEPIITTLRILAPSVTLTYNYSSGVYYVDGDFSDAPGTGGTVLLNEKPVTITEWTDSGIKIRQPESGGTLVVAVGKVRSNPVNLTEWHGRLQYTYTGRGTLTQKININLDFWGDVHSYHQDITQPSIYSPIVSYGRDVQWMTTSSCTFECSGEYRDAFDVVQETWTGSGSYPLVPASAAIGEFTCSAMIDDVGLNSQFTLRVPGNYTRWTKASGAMETPLNMTNAYLSLTHERDFVLQGGTQSIGGGTLIWNDFTTKYAPDPNAAQ